MPFIDNGSDITTYFAKKTDWSPFIEVGFPMMAGINSTYQLGNFSTAQQIYPQTYFGHGTLDGVFLKNATGLVLISEENNAYFTGSITVGAARSSPVQIGYSNWKQVSTGGTGVNGLANFPSFSLGIKINGTLWAWGNNSWGTLGTSDLTHRSSPTQVGSLSNWSQISSGGSHTAAIKTDGTLWSWGSNLSGQLGTSDLTFRYSPVQIGSLSNWSQIACGYVTTFAIKSDGTLWAWGYNNVGTLGNNSTTSFSSPIQIGVATWFQVSAGCYDAYAIDTSGYLWAWGYNLYGELGLGDTTQRLTPTQVGNTTWSQVQTTLSQNPFTFFLKSDETLWSAGYNGDGSLGLNDLTNRSSITQIGSSTWKQINAGSWNASAIDSLGQLWSWGINNAGTLGNNTTTSYSSPVQVGTLSNWSKVSCGYGTTTAIQNDGTVSSFGANSYGALGLNYFADSRFLNLAQAGNFKEVNTGATDVFLQNKDNTLLQLSTGDMPIVDPTIPWSMYDVGQYHFVGIKTDGTAWALGNNSYGQLGLSDNTHRSSLTQIGTSSNWSKVVCADYGTVLTDTYSFTWSFGKNDNYQLALSDSTNRNFPTALNNPSLWPLDGGGDYQALYNSGAQIYLNYDSTLWGMGSNGGYSLGLGDITLRSSPVQIGTLSNWAQIACGYYYTLAINSLGQLWGWGSGGGNVPLGNNSTSNMSTPVQIGTSSNWAQATTGGNVAYRFSAAINSLGQLYTWGNNLYGQLGLNIVFTTRSSPVQVGSLTNWRKVIGGGNGAIAIKTDGTLWGWGNNSYGQLGTSDLTHRSSPVQIGIDTNWAQIACGRADYILAINSLGQLYAWGNNSYGQLGLSDNTNRSSPTQVGTATNWVKVATSFASSLALNSSGQIYAWGFNNYGQLGNNATANRNNPIQIGTQTYWNNIWGSTTGMRVGGNFLSPTNNRPIGFVWGQSSGYTGNKSSPVLLTSTMTTLNVSADDNNIWVIDNNNNAWESGINNNNYFGDSVNGLYSYSGVETPIVPRTAGSLHIGNTVYYNSFYIDTGSLFVTGLNSFGQLGLNDITNRSSFVQIGSIWKRVRTGFAHMAALNTNNTLWAWGNNSFGQLGLSDQTHRSSPVQIGTLSNWIDVSCGYYHTLALNTLGELYAWGNNSWGQLGTSDVTDRWSPVQIGTSYWIDIAGGKFHTGGIVLVNTTGLYDMGSMWTWGNNSYGQLGQSNTTHRSSPNQVGALTYWIQFSAGNFHTAAVASIGGANQFGSFTFGLNSFGQLGHGDTIARYSPVQAGTYGNAFCGYNNTYFRLGFNYYITGNNSYGQLARGNQTHVSSPVLVFSPNGDNYGIGMGITHIYFIDGDATPTYEAIYMAGSNSYGQFGSLSYYPNLVQKTSDNDISKVITNNDSTFFQKTDDTLWAVGANSFGQFMMGNQSNRSSPVQITNNWGTINNPVAYDIKQGSSIIITK